MSRAIRAAVVVAAISLFLGAGASPALASAAPVTAPATVVNEPPSQTATPPVWGLHSKHASVVGCNNTGSHLLRQDLISDYFCTLQPDGWWWLMVTMM